MVFDHDVVALPALSSAEAMLVEQATLGLSPGDHIMTLYRAELRRHDILGSADVASCPDGRWVRAAGLMVVHQSPPTAKGFHFLTLEDEAGMLNVIFRPPVYNECQHVIHSELLLLVEGKVERDGDVVNILAERIRPLGLRVKGA